MGILGAEPKELHERTEVRYRYYLAIVIMMASIQASAGLLVGHAEGDITPTADEAAESCLGGYGLPYSRCGEYQILDPVTVRALYLQGPKDRMLLLVFDTIGLGSGFIEALRASVSASADIRPEEIVPIATHTHAGPDLQGLWGGIDDGYRRRVIGAATRTAARAVNEAHQAVAYFASAQADIRNRRGMDTVDSAVEALQFRRDGRPDVTLVSVSAHPTILYKDNESYSAGYVNFLRRQLEKETGAPVVFVNGILGDAEPAVDERNYSGARRFGEKVATGLGKALKSATGLDGDFEVSFHAFKHPVTNWLIRATSLLGLLDLKLEEGEVRTRIGLFRIGEAFEGILFPGEALSTLGLTIQEDLGGRYHMFIGLANDTLGYFIPSAEYNAVPGRTTEERVSISPRAGDAIRQEYEKAIDRFDRGRDRPPMHSHVIH